MKRWGLIYVFFVAIAVPVCSQDISRFSYREQVSSAGMDKSGLYKASLDWLAMSGNLKKADIKANDLAAGHFNCIAVLTDSVKYGPDGLHYTMLPVTVSYSLDLEIKPCVSTITVTGLRYKYYLPPDSYVNADDKGKMVDTTFEGLSVALIKGEIPQSRRQSLSDFLISCDKRFRAILESYKKQMSQAVAGRSNGF